MALRHDSSRDLLEELEDGWGAAPTPAGGISLSGGPQANAKAAEPPSESAPAEAGADDLPTHTASSPDLKSLDEGWLDDLFPGEEPDDDEDDDEPEPELPDERLDPEAFALAKKARDERAAKKKDKKRSKADAKRARQKARAEAMRQKQKAKKARPAAQARKVPEPSSKKTARNTNVGEDRSASADTAREQAAEERNTSRSRAKVVAPRRAPSTLASVKLLAIVLAILLAIAAAVAAIVK